MSHHIVTVCVVCVLCAAHVPCSAHTNPSATNARTFDSSSPSTKNPFSLNAQWLPSRPKDAAKDQDRSPPSNNFNSNKHDSRKIAENFKGGGNVRGNTVQSSLAGEDNPVDPRDAELLQRLAQVDSLSETRKSAQSTKDLRAINTSRVKRDVDVDERYFMRKIFEAYGDGTSITMEGFERLVQKLGLLRLLIDSTELQNNSSDRNRTRKLDKSSAKGLHDTDSKSNRERCLNTRELLSTVAQDTHYASNSNTTTLPSWLFERVCPALVYQLAAESSSERNGCIRVPGSYRATVNKSMDKFFNAEDSERNTVIVWVYSTVSILIISISGLFGVAVIPFMGKYYYHHVLQFLVALAVGTLTGDALIHLLPHAMMMPHHHDHDEHDFHLHQHQENSGLLSHTDQHSMNMWKGLVAMISLVSFFFTEKTLNMLAEWHKHRQRRNKLHTRVRVIRETDGPNSNVVGEKLCKHKYSSYPYCYGEIATETQEMCGDNHHNRQISHHERPPMIEEEKPLTSNCNSVTKIVANDMEKKPKDDWRLDESIVINSKKNADGVDAPLNESESYTVIIREHETKHHGHSHSHGHVHSAPESMSSVAWMVVMGDGLHNFTDGMAIGAAFSANIAGGFSTAIAVFCHELPHELGDFAVLLKAGMSTKQAVFYNLLSSVLCLFGMIFGVLLGNTPAATSWVFAAAAGIFIYIALVDMIPELSSSHSAESGSRWQFIWQGLGLFTGLGIMLLIAAYEHDLKHIFNN